MNIKRASLFLLIPFACFAQTIAEKVASTLPLEGAENLDLLVKETNQQLISLRGELEQCYKQAKELCSQGAEEEEFLPLLEKTNALKLSIQSLENGFRASVVKESKKEEEGYALWDQEETTLSQLVMEYGALDYLFIIPPEMSSLKLNMHSNILIPRESWPEMLEVILSHYGIGVKKINPYVKQLYILKQDPSAIQTIASSREQLQWIADHSRLFYVLSPPVEQVKSTFQFMERFADTKQTFVYQIGAKVAIVASKEEVLKLLDLYQTIWQNSQGKVSKVVPITKMAVREMEKILQSFFSEAMDKNRPPFGRQDQEGLHVFALNQGNALVLLGQEEVVDRAERVIKDTEEQMQDPAEMTVSLYQCRHSNPEDLAKVLEKVYNSLLVSSTEANKELDVNFNSQGPQFKTAPPDGYPPQTPPLVVAPPPIKTGNTASLEVEQGTDHFIADAKTGTLLMVVRRDSLAKIKDLLRKLDVPKKMVQIEVMLFEKRIKNENSYGINMLKFGSKHDNMLFTSNLVPSGSGVLQYMLNAGSSKHIAFDLAMNFLMAQEDVQLNVAPSVVTVNQTETQISIVEEISINNGAAPVDTNKGIAFEKSYTRTQYGITINMTPTIHVADEEEEGSDGKAFVTLQTNITFDTPQHHVSDDRPLVHRRHIQNEVRVLDGQTVILGGLRRKTVMDNEEKIPFLGDIPGIGKLFGSMKLVNHNTEMFIFITPTLVLSPEEELIRIREEEVKKRPGDIPEYLQRLVKARDKERKRYFRNSFKALFGNSNV